MKKIKFRRDFKYINHSANDIEFNKHLRILNSEFDFIRRQYEILKSDIRSYDDFCLNIDMDDVTIVQKLYNRLDKGFTIEQAIKTVAYQNGYTYEEIEKFWNSKNLQRNYIKKYAYKFFCFMLKKQGFKIADIARLLEKSAGTVQKLLKEGLENEF